MTAILDVGTLLLPAGVISASQDGTPLQVNPRLLPTSTWAVHVSVPPAASATFTLAVASSQNGTYTTISTLVWPAGTSGARQVPLGVQGNMAQFVNNQAAWVRVSVTTTGALTMSGSWLTKPADGGPGLGADALDPVNSF
jgi:hypothetical protein